MRMPRERLPRKLLFGWVDHPRRSGGQELTFGRRLERTVKAAVAVAPPGARRAITGNGINGGRIRQPGMGWMEYAKDRVAWQEVVKTVPCVGC